MTGRILEYNSKEQVGTISAENGKRYTFLIEEWKGKLQPIVGTNVDFAVNNEIINDVYPIENDKITAKKIVGIIIIIIGLIVSFLGVTKVIELNKLDTSNPYVNVALKMQGLSLESLWLQYGGMSLIGLTMVIVGFIMLKKPKL